MKTLKQLMTTAFTLSLLFSLQTLEAQAKKATSSSKNASAKSSKASANKTSSASSSAKLGTDFSFDPGHVHGKYQSASSPAVTVEGEKDLVDLLGMRRHFKDRLKEQESMQP